MKRLTHFVWAGLALVCLFAASRQNVSLRQMRRDLHLTQADPLENAPPLVAFTTVGLGGFRGILADILWIRAGQLQEDGKYFELVQLADWITKLEPRLTTVWAFQAWNLAYNISVLFDSPEDRWRWVNSGLKLLRDEGLKYNPGDARLIYELGWIFQHKIGGNTDQMHMYYKREWAREMGTLFKGPTPDFDAIRANPERLHLCLDVFKLDPLLMKEVEERYGPLDWRLPQAHAIYWAAQSLKIAKGFDAISAERMIFQSMADALREGRLFESPAGNIFILTPNLELVPRIRKSFDDAIAGSPGEETFKTAHMNFLSSAAVMLFSYNRLQEARDIFDELKQRYPAETAGKSFDEYVLAAYRRTAGSLGASEAYSLIEGTLTQSLFWQAMGDNGRAAGYASLATMLWTDYMTPREHSPEFKERTGLPPLNEIRATALQRLRAQFPQSAAIQTLSRMTGPPAAE